MKAIGLVRWRAIGLVVAWLMACFLATANELTIRRWTSDDGLPQNRISALSQTPDGYLWCGTWFGLARFDGVRFTVFEHESVPAFHHNAVNALAVDQVDGALWVGTREGLLRFHAGQWQHFGIAEGLPGKVIWRLLPRQAGGVWLDTDWQVAVVTAGGLLWCSPQLVETGSLPKGDTIRQLVADKGDRLTFVTDSGLKSIRLGAMTAESIQPSAVTDTPWRAVLLDGEGKLELLGTRNGLARLRDDARTWLIEAPHGVTEETVLLHRDAAGTIWGAPQDRGLGRIREGVWEPVALRPGQRPTDLTSALNDREGGLWLGTSDGLFRVQAAAARTFTSRDGLPQDEVWLAHEARDGAVWLGTGGGVARLREDRVETFADEPHPQLRSGSLWGDAAGGLWLAKGEQLFFREADGPFRPVAEVRHVNCLYGDRTERLWIAGKPADSMRVWQDGRFSKPPVGLPPEAEVKVIHEARDGAFWFGTQRHGVFRWRAGELDRFTARDGLASDAVWAIHEDADGGLWLGGERGLTRMEMRNAERGARNADPRKNLLTSAPTRVRAFAFRRSHGLPAEEINQVLEDDFGHLWLGTLRGVLRVRRAALEAIAAGQAERAAVAMFGTADGMESSETNGERQPAGCKTRDGRIWFPTTRGVTVFDPQTLLREENPPAVVIEEAVVDGEAVSSLRPQVSSRVTGGVGADLKPGTSDLKLALAPGRARLMQFRYTAPTFVNAERARFRHRLRGRDDAWHEAGEERVAYFNDLKPGDYVFEVKACNAHGVWQERPSTFAFSLAPSFTQTTWFPASLALGGAALAGAFVTWRLRWQRRSLRAEQAAAMSGERARIAQDLHDDLGTALTGVALELDVLRRESGSSPAADERLTASATKVRTLAARMREVVWAVNPRCDTVPSLAGFLEQQAGPLLAPAGITPRFGFPAEIPALPLDSATRHQLALAVREVLVNVVRHSQATEAGLSLRVERGALWIELADNGRGFDAATVNSQGHGHGLANVRERLERLGGSCAIQSQPGQGTRVTLQVPLPEGAKGRP